MQIIFTFFKLRALPPFGKELLTRLTICSLCIVYSKLVISRFVFKRRILVLIVIVPVIAYFLLLVHM